MTIHIPGKNIKAVFFDLGNVLVDFNWNDVMMKLEPDITVPVSRINAYILHHPQRYAYEKGNIDTDSFFSWMKDELGYRKSIEELIHTWSDIFNPLPERINLLSALKQRYKLGMISNTCDAHFRLLKADYDFFEIFDHLTLSFETGFMKPEPEIYHFAGSALNVLPSESVFIDDLGENIAAARDLGWNTVHIRPDEPLEPVLRRYKII